MQVQTEVPMYVGRVAEVWAVFRRHRPQGANLEMISRELHLPKNQITGRVHDLLDCEPALIVYAGMGFCPYSRRHTKFWRAI